MFLDDTYFQGELSLPNLKYSSCGISTMLEIVGHETLEWYIEKYEQRYLVDLLGEDLYSRFIAGLAANDETDEKWIDLRNKIFNVSGEFGYSPAANYVYFFAYRDGQTKTSMNGEVRGKQSEASIVSANRKLAKAWNDMVDMSEDVRKYVRSHEDYYGEIVVTRNWKYINTFGI